MQLVKKIIKYITDWLISVLSSFHVMFYLFLSLFVLSSFHVMIITENNFVMGCQKLWAPCAKWPWYATGLNYCLHMGFPLKIFQMHQLVQKVILDLTEKNLTVNQKQLHYWTFYPNTTMQFLYDLRPLAVSSLFNCECGWSISTLILWYSISF